jgi:hypothetical protein
MASAAQYQVSPEAGNCLQQDLLQDLQCWLLRNAALQVRHEKCFTGLLPPALPALLPLV